MTAKLIISEHDQLGGLTDDDHTNYFYLPGRAGGQTAIGGTLTTELLTFQDNVVDARQFTWGPGVSAGLLDLQTNGHDVNTRHLGLSEVGASNGHMILGQEDFSGSGGNKIGIGMFPAYLSGGAAGDLYAMQGNVFFGNALWPAGSIVGSLQFFPAPDYQYGSTSWGNTNLSLVGITTGGCVNIFGRTITTDALIGIAVGTLSHVFGAPGAVSANRAAAIDVLTPSATTGTITVQTGIQVNPQLYGSTNQGIWMNGDAVGSDIVLGTAKSANIFYNGSNLIIDPDLAGSGSVYIGTTGDDTLRLATLEVAGATQTITGSAGLLTLTATNTTLTGALNIPEFIYHDGDTNTYIQFRDDRITFTCGVYGMLDLREQAAAQDYCEFNPGYADIDFYVEGDTGRVIEVVASSDGLGFFGVAAVSKPSAYTVTNHSTDKTYDANSTTIDELADVLGTLIADLQSLGLVG